MKPEQKSIFYVCGDSIERVDLMPQTESLKDKGYEVLYLVDSVDEFALRMLETYEEKDFRNISADDLGIETEEEKKEAEKKLEDSKALLDRMKTALEGKVVAVKISNRLSRHPVCLSSEGSITLEMEKVLNSMPNGEKVKAQRVLELNPQHPVFDTLTNLNDDDKLKVYSELLYNQALLIEGFPVDDPVDFSNKICELMK